MSHKNDRVTGGGKDQIGRQIVLPFRKAFKIAWKSIRIRIWRSMITTSGIVLAIAFLMSVWTSGVFTDRLREVPESDPRYEIVQQALQREAIAQGKITVRIGILGGADIGESGNTLDLVMRDMLENTEFFAPNILPQQPEELRETLQPEEKDKGVDSILLLSLSPQLANEANLEMLTDFTNNGGTLVVLGHHNIVPENGSISTTFVDHLYNLLSVQPGSKTVKVTENSLERSDHSAIRQTDFSKHPELTLSNTTAKDEATSLVSDAETTFIWMAQQGNGFVFWLPLASEELTNPTTVNWLFSNKVIKNIFQWTSRGELQGDVMGKRKLWLVSLSLLVCIVGITNAMLMSVTERFREIGTMKCLGALDRFVVRLFLIESSFQGAVGSLLGAVIGLMLSALRTIFAYRITDVATGQTYWLTLEFFPFSRIMFWMLVSILVGIVLSVVAAIYPAYRAARMEPVDAMRTEA